MSNKDFKGKNPVEEPNAQNVANEEATNLQEQAEKKAEETTEGDNTSDELTALQQKYDELNDTHLRLRAEFDNYRKRTLREKSDLIKSGGENALTNLLPVIDDFERAIQAQPKALSPLSKNFEKTLKSIGLQKIDSAIGTEFNPDLHEAISVDGDGDKETIDETLRAGYYYGDEVLRTAMVRVSKS